MIAELGHILLITALVIATLQAVLPLWGAHKQNTALMDFAGRAAGLQAVTLIGAFGLLTAAFITSDFSVKLAAEHSHSAKPLLYKISGVWGNHEGSMMLWVLIMAIYGALAARFSGSLPKTLRARTLAIQGLLSVGFISFVLWTSNPFWRLENIPADGAGLNPLLQDPGLALHPPFLYLGYVGFSLAFSMACAALIEGKIDEIWARWLRPWVLLAWSFLTVGITLGSLWAYYELGWGGWWMWDPVENVSFMPWLAGTALLHSVLILGTRGQFASWTVLLAISTFSLSLIGTFVVRSGVLISVHAFAVDPARGVFILGLLSLITGGALVLYMLRAGHLRTLLRALLGERFKASKLVLTSLEKPASDFKAMSKEGSLLLNNIFLVVATTTILLGTFYPLFVEALSPNKITVGAPYFNKTFTPVMMLLLLVMGVGPLLRWISDDPKNLKKFLLYIVPPALIAGVISLLSGQPLGTALGLALALYVTAGVALVAWKRSRGSLSRLLRQPASFYGFVTGHLGMAVITLAIAVMSTQAGENIGRIKIGESLDLSAYKFTLTDVTNGQRENYTFRAGKFDVTYNGRPLTQLQSEQRYYPVRGMVTSEAGFKFAPVNTVFAALSDGDNQQGWVVRVYHHPMVVWIWIGGFMMALAGFISLLRRARLWQTDPVMIDKGDDA